MEEVRVLSASGQIGSGFLESSIARGFSLDPHVIACDGGSTDAGPAHLGSGQPHFSREGTKRDLRLMLQGRDRLGIPLIVGSCGMGGGDAGVDWMRDIALEIAEEEGLTFTLALIRSEQDRTYLKEKLNAGKIAPLDPAPDMDEALIDRSAHIVGMMGHEPIAAAIEAGADVVLAGRASDTSLFACVPLMKGAGAGPAWHAAKILECGTAAVVQRKRPDSIFAWIREDHFDIEAMDPDCRCTPQSIASHTLYENADPFLIREPGGTIDTTTATYEALDERRVRVSGSTFAVANRLTIKLEGAEMAGYQTIVVGGVREPYILRQLDSWIDGMREKFADRVVEMFAGKLERSDYAIHARVYGRDGVMGRLEPTPAIGHEVGILFTITAPTQAIANSIGKTFAHFALHYPIPEWRGLISGLAFPMSPPEVDRGPVYRFNINHIVTPDDPNEMFRTELLEVHHG